MYVIAAPGHGWFRVVWHAGRVRWPFDLAARFAEYTALRGAWKSSAGDELTNPRTFQPLRPVGSALLSKPYRTTSRCIDIPRTPLGLFIIRFDESGFPNRLFHLSSKFREKHKSCLATSKGHLDPARLHHIHSRDSRSTQVFVLRARAQISRWHA